MEYQLTPEIKAQLRAIAEKLHPLPEWTKKFKEVDGAFLLEQGYKSIKKNNEMLFVIAGKKYTVPDGYTAKDINHVEHLFKNYKLGGILAVHGYMVGLVEHEQKSRTEHPELFEDNGQGKYRGVGSPN